MTEEKTWANISRFQTYLFNSGDNLESWAISTIGTAMTKCLKE